MLLKIIVIGKLKDHLFSSKCDEFAKWITKYGKIEITELKDENKERENSAILSEINKEKGYIIALSEEGKLFSSEKFSQHLAAIDRKIVFIIGGPYGLLPEVKAKADLLLSLSPMTFTHEIARLLLLEQIYRAANIAHNGKYHNP
ncbi:MAG: 23S rRNA (pseudouridine(1915)-N(3))-methyltransferase RlmH [Lentisphaeria bacterium]|nr:23S rRNA (pseudouridine(1915)-N(3))-methyltransferase RlmH [Lentisphaeria bacterium]